MYKYVSKKVNLNVYSWRSQDMSELVRIIRVLSFSFTQRILYYGRSVETPHLFVYYLSIMIVDNKSRLVQYLYGIHTRSWEILSGESKPEGPENGQISATFGQCLRKGEEKKSIFTYLWYCQDWNILVEELFPLLYKSLWRGSTSFSFVDLYNNNPSTLNLLQCLTYPVVVGSKLLSEIYSVCLSLSFFIISKPLPSKFLHFFLQLTVRQVSNAIRLFSRTLSTSCDAS